jgi:N-dimethylarginine dimethylaminohydrolase
MAKLSGGQSMVAPLRSVLLCPPRSAGWPGTAKAARWRALGFSHAPQGKPAEEQFDRLKQLLAGAGVRIIPLPETASLTLDAVYVHDASFMTDHGAICLRMGKPSRAGEPAAHRDEYRELGVPILGEIEAPGTAEGGDIVWLNAATLLVGRGYRTNASGIRQLGDILAPKGVAVVPAPLPHGDGPEVCLHLMSLISLLDERTALVDLPLLAVETVELLREHGFRSIEIDPSERGSLACNVLSLGNRKLVALAENRKTNGRLRQEGFEVLTFSGSEIAINGGGGPTCLTRPILRGP